MKKGKRDDERNIKGSTVLQHVQYYVDHDGTFRGKMRCERYDVDGIVVGNHGSLRGAQGWRLPGLHRILASQTMHWHRADIERENRDERKEHEDCSATTGSETIAETRERKAEGKKNNK